MDFLNDSVFNLFGRADFVGGIDNEALDFGQLEPFVHLPAINTSNNNGNTSAITLAVTTITAVTTTTSSIASSTATTHGTLPESPPDSGSEPPYSPDLHGLNQIQYHQHHYPQQIDTSMHLTEPQNEMHQNTQTMLGLDSHHQMNMARSSAQRSNGNSVLGLNADDDFNCLMTDPMFQATVLSQLTPITSPTIVNTSQDPSSHLINTRKRTMSAYAPNDSSNTIENDPTMASNIVPIKRPVILSAIKSEPDGASLSSVASSSTNVTNSANSPPLVQSQQQQQSSSVLSENGSNDSFPMQCIRFLPFQQQNWHILCDQSLQELPLPHYRVDADKGFNFSNSDDAFVCQKKNHFQITCHAQLQGATAIFVRTETGLEKIKSFHLHFYGVKLETPTQTIRIEQSQSDRSKKPFHPVPIDLQGRQVSKITVGRLHFSETTSNNMRKKGRPNPEQRYFQLVVGLHAHTHSGNFPVISHGSERIIVRASNPGQFESDVEVCWQRGLTQDSIFTHAGRVGINTDRPDESLVVHGNLKISGHIVQPSDSRAKQEIGELDTSQQLQNVKRIRVVKYRYEPSFAMQSGLTGNLPAVHSSQFNKYGKNDKNDAYNHNNVIDVIDTGVIAQEVREVLPDAVQEAGSVVLSNGEVIDNFLLVNKDRIYMENIGAVKELCKVTGSLETRIEQLERINSRLVQIKKIDKSDCLHSTCKFSRYTDDPSEPCSNKMIQLTIVVLVIIMAICLAAISTLYFVEHTKQNDWYHYFRHYENENGFYERHTRTGNDSTYSDLTNGSVIAGQSRGILIRNNTANHLKNNNWPYMTKKYNYASHEQDQRLILTKSHDTQNSNVTALKIVSSPPSESQIPETGYDIGLSDGDIMKVTSFVHTTTDDLEKEKPFDYEHSERKYSANADETLENNIGKKKNDSVHEFIADATSEKPTKLEKTVENYSDWTNNSIPDSGLLFNDVDSNFIDAGQQSVRNTSEVDDKNVVGLNGNEPFEFRNSHSQKDHITLVSEFHKEHKIRTPIGLPSHCVSSSVQNSTLDSEAHNGSFTDDSISKGNKTLSDQSVQSSCVSACVANGNLLTVKSNLVPDLPDVPEMAIPENVDVIETSTAFKRSKIPTTKLLPINAALINNNNLSQTPFEETITNDKLTSFETSTQQSEKSSNKVNRIAVQAEQPIEIRDLPSTSQNTSPPPPSQSTLINKVANAVYSSNKQNKTKTDVDGKQQEVEPFLREETQINSDKFHENDIKINFNKKSQSVSKFDKAIAEVDIETALPFTKLSHDIPSSTAQTLTAAANPTSKTTCFLIYLLIRSETFNSTLGSDEICHSFNVTYNIPLSKFMKENRFELIFATPSALQWSLGSTRDSGEIKANHAQSDGRNIINDATYYAIFDIDVPAFGEFDRQMVFHGNLHTSDVNASQSTIAFNANPIQSVLYKINFYRDCSQ